MPSMRCCQTSEPSPALYACRSSPTMTKTIPASYTAPSGLPGSGTDHTLFPVAWSNAVNVAPAANTRPSAARIETADMGTLQRLRSGGTSDSDGSDPECPTSTLDATEPGVPLTGWGAGGPGCSGSGRDPSGGGGSAGGGSGGSGICAAAGAATMAIETAQASAVAPLIAPPFHIANKLFEAGAPARRFRLSDRRFETRRAREMGREPATFRLLQRKCAQRDS